MTKVVTARASFPEPSFAKKTAWYAPSLMGYPVSASFLLSSACQCTPSAAFFKLKKPCSVGSFCPGFAASVSGVMETVTASIFVSSFASTERIKLSLITAPTGGYIILASIVGGFISIVPPKPTEFWQVVSKAITQITPTITSLWPFRSTVTIKRSFAWKHFKMHTHIRCTHDSRISMSTISLLLYRHIGSKPLMPFWLYYI